MLDPYFLHHVTTANAELNYALENLTADDPDYDNKQNDLIVATTHLERMITREVTRANNEK